LFFVPSCLQCSFRRLSSAPLFSFSAVVDVTGPTVPASISSDAVHASSSSGASDPCQALREASVLPVYLRPLFLFLRWPIQWRMNTLVSQVSCCLPLIVRCCFQGGGSWSMTGSSFVDGSSSLLATLCRDAAAPPPEIPRDVMQRLLEPTQGVMSGLGHRLLPTQQIARQPESRPPLQPPNSYRFCG
jgi:hypothetical protein